LTLGLTLSSESVSEFEVLNLIVKLSSTIERSPEMNGQTEYALSFTTLHRFMLAKKCRGFVVGYVITMGIELAGRGKISKKQRVDWVVRTPRIL
jgi:hypothetical protein